MKEDKFYKNWTFCNLEISSKEMTVVIVGRGENQILHLQNYLLRSSKTKERKAFVL